MTVKLLTEHHLEFLTLNGFCTDSSESTLVNCHIVGNLMSQLNCSFPAIVTADQGHDMYFIKIICGSLHAYGFSFNCTTVGQASNSMKTLT